MNFDFTGMSDDAIRGMFLTYFAAFVAFATIVIVGITFSERSMIVARLKKLQLRREELQTEIKAPTKRKNTEKDESIKNFAQRFNLIQEGQIQQYRELLISCGEQDKNAVFRIAIQKAVMPFGLGILFYFALGLTLESFKDPGWKNIALIAGMYLGFKLPDILLKNRRNKRWEKIRKALPDGLDLLMVCAEAGLTINLGFDRVAKELQHSYPELAEEFTMTSIEMSFLPDKKKALENLQKRVNLEEIRGIASVIAQTEKYGTPVAQALRALSSEFRMQRMLRAEQKAARLPAIMTIPMMLFILPVLFAVVITPAMINVSKAWK